MAAVEREEFLVHMGILREDIRGVHERLDNLNGRTRETEQAVAVLEDRTRQKTSFFSGGSAMMIGAVEALRHLLPFIKK